MSQNFFPITDNNYHKIISFEALLPNLRYKNNNIYFISKYPIKIKKNNKIIYINEYLLENISLTGKITCIDTELNCTILEKEDNNGLIVNIKFRDGPFIYKQDMQKYARAIEAAILGIDLMEDNETDISDTCSDNDYSYYVNKMYDDEISNYGSIDEYFDENSNQDILEENYEYFEENNN